MQLCDFYFLSVYFKFYKSMETLLIEQPSNIHFEKLSHHHVDTDLNDSYSYSPDDALIRDSLVFFCEK